jgi:multimeric flavodoxin WrbA
MKEKARKKLLALYFSPRRPSNSGRLLDAAIEPALSAGFEVEKLHLSDLDIAPCNACGTCYDGSPCPIRDDMTRIYPLIENATDIIIATPVYFYGIPAKAKALIDRCQIFWARKYLIANPLPPRTAAVIEVAGSGGKRVFDGINLTIRYFLDSISINMPATLELRHIDCIPKDLPKSALDAANKYGSEFVDQIKKRSEIEN